MGELRAHLRPNIVKSDCQAGSVEHAWLPSRGEGEYVSMSAASGICLSFSTHPSCLVVIAGKRLRRDVEPGSVQVTGPEPAYWHAVKGHSDVIEVIATPEVRSAIAQEMRVPAAVDLDDLPGGFDPVVWAIAVRLRTALRVPGQATRLEYDELIWHLYRRVFATAFGGRLVWKGGRLDQRRVGRVLAYIDAHLTDGDLSVAGLSRVASLSPFHFLRSFRRTLNMTPHAYVRARRLERARAVLAAGGGLREVATSHGFTHVRHFRLAYTRHHGLAPGEDIGQYLTPPT